MKNIIRYITNSNNNNDNILSDEWWERYGSSPLTMLYSSNIRNSDGDVIVKIVNPENTDDILFTITVSSIRGVNFLKLLTYKSFERSLRYGGKRIHKH